MGGELFETESERLMRIGREEGREEGMAQEIIESGQEFGLDDTAIIKRLQKKLSFTPEKANTYMEKYGKVPV
jgi:hypothetical protein